MKADIITIGDEIVIGQIIDTNSAYLASELTTIGFTVRRKVSVKDNAEQIINTLDESVQKSDLVLITGGLGPTSDDITKDTLTHYFHGKYILHDATLKQIIDIISRRGHKISERNRKQALLPDVCEPLTNALGTAPGMLFRKNDCIIISLPGVPFEMQNIFEREVKPRLLLHFNLPQKLHRTILIVGLAESEVADQLKHLECKLDKDFKLAYMPSPGLLRLRLSISGDNRDYLNEKLNRKLSEIIKILGEKNVFGYDNDSLSGVIAVILQKYGFKLSIAESCTGGYIAHLITSIPGASQYYIGGITAYSNEVKENSLHVNPTSISKHGAVSQEVAEEMASSIKRIMKTDFSIATTGIAGPDGGSAEKPIGTTWIAVATPKKVISQCFLFGYQRERNIIRASLSALNMLRIELIEYTKK